MTRHVIASAALAFLGMLAAFGAVLETGLGSDTAGEPVAIERALAAGTLASPADVTPSPEAPAESPAGPPLETEAPTLDVEPAAVPVRGSLWPMTRNARLGTSDSALPAPVLLEIPAIGVDAPIDPYGVNAATGDMEVPENVSDVAWYRHGPRPGESGSAVLAAHVDLFGQGPGVFFDLIDLEPGQVISVRFDDGSTSDFQVHARTTYRKDELPVDAIFSRGGPSVLTLITCGGGFDSSSRHYDSNVVVYAVPIASIGAGPAHR
jgi:hypothetical protein